MQPYCEQHKSFFADRFVEGEYPLYQYPDARGGQCDKCGHLYVQAFGWIEKLADWSRLDPLDLINPKCKLNGAAPIPRETRHGFVLLDKLQPVIEEWSKKPSVKGSWSHNGKVITES